MVNIPRTSSWVSRRLIQVDIVCAPPTLFIRDFISSKPSHVQVAGHNCYPVQEGAFTGEIR
jgi:triosephosphate isomerase